MKCHFCNGKLKRGVAPLDLERNGYRLHFDRLPAWVCPQCGEAFFDEPEVDCVQKVVKNIDKHTAALLAPA